MTKLWVYPVSAKVGWLWLTTRYIKNKNWFVNNLYWTMSGADSERRNITNKRNNGFPSILSQAGSFFKLTIGHICYIRDICNSQYSEKLSICGAGKENPWRLMNPPFSHSLFGKIFWWELQQRFLHNKCQITEPFLHNFVHCGSKALTHISKIGTWKSFICPNNIFLSSVVRVWRNPSPRLAPVLEPP